MPIHDKHFPNESEAYRKARNKLLKDEIALRRQIEKVAAQRRDLPPGGKLKEDYVFTEGPRDLASNGPAKKTKLSALFGKHDTLMLYSLMYRPGGTPCMGCTSVIDGLQGNVKQIEDRVAFAVVAKAPVAEIRRWALTRGWQNPRFLSSGGNSYNADYLAEDAKGDQYPIMNVFRRDRSGIRHFWACEILYAPTEPGQDERHVDPVWPLWNAFDMTPDGRGEGFPAGTYKQSLKAIGKK